jgi:DNA-binding MarR family transcriptional regulator
MLNNMMTELGTATPLRHAVMRLSRRLRQEGTVQGSLTMGSLATLATVDVHGPMTLGELAQAERVKPPSITRVVVALEAEGLLVRRADPSDGRVSLVAVTRAGKALLAQQRRRRDQWLDARLAELSEQDRELLDRAAEVLERLARS